MPPTDQPAICARACPDHEAHQPTKLIVMTGGPGAGKTAILEILRRQLCRHVAILPEAAGIVFGGGFWRLSSETGRVASQRAIVHIQREMEELAKLEGHWPTVLCDRGLFDGLAYWPRTEPEFWAELNMDRSQALARYAAVIHLRTPDEAHGYNHSNVLRIETAEEAARIDKMIETAWAGHPRYMVIESADDFMTKARAAMNAVLDLLPEPCRVAVGQLTA